MIYTSEACPKCLDCILLRCRLVGEREALQAVNGITIMQH